MVKQRRFPKKYLLPIIFLSVILLALSASTVIQTNNLHRTQDTLAFTQSELTTTQTSLAETEAQLATTQTSLAQTEAQLATTQTNLAQTEAQLATTQTQLQLYKDTWGSVVASDIQPPYQRAYLERQAYVTNPTWAQLLDFILKDKTDQKAYVPDVYMCGDFARDVYNNAEQSGIRAAWVAIKFGDSIHACNAFKTTDRGLVFINCAGLEAGTLGPFNRDKIVNVRLGNDYIPLSLFPEYGWEVAWGNVGTILDVQIYW
ncbi:hypothetical protein ES708_07538 [subsurface metagenome]